MLQETYAIDQLIGMEIPKITVETEYIGGLDTLTAVYSLYGCTPHHKTD